MKRTGKVFALLSVLLALAMTICAFAAETQNPTYGSVFYPDEEILAEFGPSEVVIPFSDSEEAEWVPVENSFKFLMIDGTLEKDAQIFTEAGTTLVPVRLVSEKLGANVDYSAEEKKIIIDKDDTEIVLFSGSNKAYVNGEESELAAPVKNVEGTTYIPIRFIVENLGGEADYLVPEEDYIPSFPTVVIDSKEFLAIERMSDEEVLVAAKEKLLAAYEELDEYMHSTEFEYPIENLDEILAELKEDLESAELGGKYASCYVIINTEFSRFVMNTINGDFYTLSGMTFSLKLQPFDYYDIGNARLFN